MSTRHTLFSHLLFLFLLLLLLLFFFFFFYSAAVLGRLDPRRVQPVRSSVLQEASADIPGPLVCGQPTMPVLPGEHRRIAARRLEHRLTFQQHKLRATAGKLRRAPQFLGLRARV
eukprot:SAG22_NODE_494_length_9810_cov_2.202966_7_plen_115_part_00